jgi:RimJ/RimL family protein N-acetyltransferase
MESSASPKIEYTYDLDRVLEFMNEHGSTPMRWSIPVAMGLLKDGELVAGVVFDNVGKHNAWLHIAAKPGGRWLIRSAIARPFFYAFKVCKLDRISGYINATNYRTRKFVEHLGFRPEAVLRGAAEDGGDIVIYVMFSKDCRYV